jgi:hypothetical protein
MVRLSAGLALFGAMEAGYVALPVRGTINDGATLVAADGAWLGATIGAAYGW